jgi:tetratricopeptide (TPR) repeat protein
MPMSTLHDTGAILMHLRRMSGSRVFARAGRMYPLLQYLVDAALAGDGDRLSQYRIATDVLGRRAQFDPSSDSIVRVEIGRLRNKLREYYESDGREDRVRFELPKGGYRLLITVDTETPRAAEGGASGTQTISTTSTAALPLAAGSRRGRSQRRVSLIALTALAVIALGGAGSIWLVRAIERVSNVQDDNAARARGASSAELSAAEPRAIPAAVPQAPTASPEAYDLFLRIPTVSPVERIALLDRALAIDPDFAEAHAWKAYLLSYAVVNSAFGPALELPGEDLGQLVERHAREAIALDGDMPLAHVALGSLYLFTWRWTDARHSFEWAATVAPNEDRLLNQVYLDAFSGRSDEALRLVDRLIRHNPENSTPLHSIRGLVLAIAGALDAAAASLREGIAATTPMNEAQIQSMLVERSWLAAVEIARGDANAALLELRIIENLSVETRDIELPFVAYAYARLGGEADARRLLAELEPAMKTGAPYGAGASALVHLANGDSDAAHESLENAARKAARHEPDEHFFALMLLRANLFADPVLDQPEFVDVLSRIAGH